MCNRPEDAARQLKNPDTNERVKAKVTYCILCSHMSPSLPREENFKRRVALKYYNCVALASNLFVRTVRVRRI